MSILKIVAKHIPVIFQTSKFIDIASALTNSTIIVKILTNSVKIIIQTWYSPTCVLLECISSLSQLRTFIYTSINPFFNVLLVSTARQFLLKVE